jgi:hypothetical protein
MKIYFSLGAIPELSALPRGERVMAYHACRKHASRHWQVWLGSLLGLVVGVAAGIAALYLLLEWHPLGRLPTYFIAGVACGALIVGITGYIRSLFVAHYIRPCLREYVSTQSSEAIRPPVREFEDSSV